MINKISHFPKLAFFAALLCLAASANASASDLENDLRTPFEPLSNPFVGQSDMPLNRGNAEQLKALIEKCAFLPVKLGTSLGTVYGEGALRDECATDFTPSYLVDRHGVTHIGNRLAIHSLQLQIVSWDGSDSDGGDEQALGIYDASGRRIAAYTALFADGNVVDGIAHAVNAKLPEIQK